MSAIIGNLIPDDREKSKTLRAILETWSSADLREVIERAWCGNHDYIDFIMNEGLLDDEIDEIIAQEIAEGNPVVAHLVVLEAKKAWDSPHQDCAHVEFDLVDVCRMCGRHRSLCEAA